MHHPYSDEIERVKESLQTAPVDPQLTSMALNIIDCADTKDVVIRQWPPYPPEAHQEEITEIFTTQTEDGASRRHLIRVTAPYLQRVTPLVPESYELGGPRVEVFEMTPLVPTSGHPE